MQRTFATAATVLVLLAVGLPAGASAGGSEPPTALRATPRPAYVPASDPGEFELGGSDVDLPGLHRGEGGRGEGGRGEGGRLQALRAIPEAVRNGEVAYLGDETPMKLARGVNVTYEVADVDGDGAEELVQLRGTAVKPELGIVDGATGAPQWTVTLSSAFFLVRLLEQADGSGKDLLVLLYGQGGLQDMQRLSGDDGTTQWSRRVGGGGFFGLSESSDGVDIVTGSYGRSLLGLWSVNLRYWSAQTGRAGTATISLTSSGDDYSYPTAVLAGDLDGDGAGDVFTFEPYYSAGTGAAASGIVKAISRASGTTLWSTFFTQEIADHAWAVTAADMTGDGLDDVVMLSEWLGPFADGNGGGNIVSVVNGKGGDLAGVRRVMDVELHGWPSYFVSPGDVDADGKEEVIFSGAVYNLRSNAIVVLFESVGGRGLQWRAGPAHPTPYGDWGWGWWPDAGDFDGDGVVDALVLLGDRQGVQAAMPVSQQSGAVLWERRGLGGMFVMPSGADVDGDGGDEVIDQFSGQKIGYDWHFEYWLADGENLNPFWRHERALDTSAGIVVQAVGGQLQGAGVPDDVVMHYNMAQSSGRHFTEALEGPTGTLRWTDPTA